MKSMMSHCSPGFLAKNRRTSSSPTMTMKLLPVTDSWIRFLRTPKGIGSGFGKLVRVPSIRSVQRLFSLPEVFDGDDFSKIPNGSGSKTVHVKFVLQKECLFGEQFLLVGDDPMFGLWDPANAIPLEWSEEHFWTAEMDLAVGKSVQFKFIHQTTSPSAFHWQPGPDRVLQIWETTNTIVVTEDWENAEDQKLTEEQLSEVIVSENSSPPQSIEEEVTPMVAGESSPPQSIEKVIPIVAGESSPPQSIEEEVMISSSSEQSIASLLNVGMSMDDGNKGDVVVVSGPTAVPVSWSHKAAQSGKLVDALLASTDRAEEFNSMQLSEEQAEPEIPSENLLVEETIALSSSKSIDGSEEKGDSEISNENLLVEETIALSSSKSIDGSEKKGESEISKKNLLAEETIALSSSKSIDDSQETAIGVLSNDMLQWWRKAIRQLLYNLGFGRESNT